MDNVTSDSTDEATEDDSLLFLNFIILRHGSELFPVFVQCVMLLSSALLICGVIYFISFISFLVLHHFLQDRKVDLLPHFVHLNQLPHSDEESFDEEEKEALNYYEETIRQRRLRKKPSGFSEHDDADRI